MRTGCVYLKNVNNMKRIVGIEENTFSMEVTSAVQLMENREVRNFTGNRKCSEYDDKCRKIFKELMFALYIQFHISMI